MTTTSYTAAAQEKHGDFVERAGKSFLTVRTTNVFGEPTSLKITPADFAEFYLAQANNSSSGIRTLAGCTATGDQSASWPTSPSRGSRRSMSRECAERPGGSGWSRDSER